jgi:hypothetical protein
MLTTMLLALGATCPGLPNSTGEPARLTASLTEAGDVVDVLTEQMQPGNRAIVFYGTLPMDPIPWGQGDLCLNPLYTFRGPSSIADGAGRTFDTIDMQALPAGTVYMQTLYRDFGGRTFNLSNMASVGVSASSVPNHPDPAVNSPFCGEAGGGPFVPSFTCSGKPPHIVDLFCQAGCSDAYIKSTEDLQGEACGCMTDAYSALGEAYETYYETMNRLCGWDYQSQCATDALNTYILAEALYLNAIGDCGDAYYVLTEAESIAFANCMSGCCL